MEPEKDMFDKWAEEKTPLITRLKWRWEEVSRLPRIFGQSIKSVWYWLPIIWKDRHYDSHYIFEIMMYKIKAQSKYIGERDIHTRAKRDSEVMMTCVRLMKKVQDEFYRSEYSDYHKTKHWFEPTEREGYSSWESKILEENFDGYFKKYPLIYKRVLNGEGIFKLDGTDDKQRIAMNIGHINHERVRKLLFKLMEQNIERWWD
tara:strand:+ start:1194 stop:1802 length:609 start_codon:yes stop_codon:yes gene_type:complete